jgi:hypothetical protein
MALKDQNPAALSQLQRIDWSVDWINQLKGQVWGLIQNGGGGGGGTQDLQSVLFNGRTAYFPIVLLGDGSSQLALNIEPGLPIVGIDIISQDGSRGFFVRVTDTESYIQFQNNDLNYKLQLEPSGPILSNERVKIPVDTTFPLGESGILLLSDFLGASNGIATLDNDGLVPVTQLPFSAIAYQGAWNATNPPVGGSPTLTDGSGTAGDFYFVSVAGTQTFDGTPISFSVGDMVVYNGSVWQKVGTPVPTTQVVESRPDAAYSLVLTDNQKLLKFPFSTSYNITVPLNATVAFSVGSRVDIMMTNDGQATFVGETGAVLIRSKGGNTKTNGKYTVVSIEKIATDEWVLVGDLTS